MYAKLGVHVSVISVLAYVSAAAGVHQSFSLVPRNLRVREWSTATLECTVANRVGEVQWAKDGFALGYGYPHPIAWMPRYTLVGETSLGQYHLRIENVTLEDEAEFQCQVGPNRGQKPIRVNATLTVIVPPQSVKITNPVRDSKLEKKEGEEVVLECEARGARPAAAIVWYRGSVAIKEAEDKIRINEIQTPWNDGQEKNSNVTGFTTLSKIHFTASVEDDDATYSCRAHHEALSKRTPMMSTVKLSVLHAPGAPYIEGYTEGEAVRRGQSVELVCRSRGGNPPAQLIWHKNGEQVSMAYRTSGRNSENMLSFKADATDNGARYTCEAKNIMLVDALTADIDLTVLFAPTHVRISGPSEARAGDMVPLTCTTAPSNPAAGIKWVVLDRRLPEASNATAVSPQGGWTTSSNITMLVEANRETMVVACHGINAQLAETTVTEHTINILYPPLHPVIAGYVPGTIVTAGSVQKLSCICLGGNPLATLHWYKNEKKIHSVTTYSNKSVAAVIDILVNETDNQARYKCEATNTATVVPLFETVALNVHYAPETLKLRSDPPELKPDAEATLHCDASSSNPPATLSWWRNGIPVEEGAPTRFKKGLHGGTVSSIALRLNVTKDMDGVVYSCQALNDAINRTVNDALKLRVLYAPVFDGTTSREIVGVEGEPLLIQLKADANPNSVIYTWTKDGLPVIQFAVSGANDRIMSDGGLLNISRVTQHDAGVYTCEAANSQGSAAVNVTVTVQYSAVIKSLSQTGGASNSSEDVVLACTVAGNPLGAEHVRWERPGHEVDPTAVTFEPHDSTSYLLVENVTRDDVGLFTCVVDNGIGGPKRREVMLVAKFKPEMDANPNLSKSGINVGQVGRLTCKCRAAPAPHFTWYKNGVMLPVNASTKYAAEYHNTDPVTYASVLLVNGVTSSDYGAYECEARNELGYSVASVKLDITSAPDQVTSLRVSNTSDTSITLEWEPGFDGGLPTWFRIRHRKLDESMYKYEDVPLNATAHTVTALDKSQEYVFSIMAINSMGQSKYRPDEVRATTCSSSEDNESEVVSTQIVDADMYKFVVVYMSASGGAVLVLVNVALVVCYFVRRRLHRSKDQDTPEKGAEIEMYAPSSSYNGTLTGDTLSSVSEKSETESNDGYGNGQGPPIPDVPTTHIYPQEQDLVIPAPLDYAVYEGNHARTLPHPHRHKDHYGHSTLGRAAGAGKAVYVPPPSPMPPLDGSYYNMSSDRYLSYPPIISEYLHPHVRNK